MRQYGADQIDVTWRPAGVAVVDFKEGFARGTFIQPTANTQSATYRSNGMGGTVPLFNRDTSGVLAVMIDVESRVHQELVTAWNVHRLVRTVYGPIVVRDGNTREVAFYNKASIMTMPDVPKGSTGGVIVWRFNYESLIQQPFGFNANAVGAA